MAGQKRKFKWFSIPEWEKEEEWLREQHKQGWKLIKVSVPGIYTFEACEPEDVIYQLDYNQEGMNNLSEYTQMFRDCGWEYVGEMVGYAYFRKSASEMVEDEAIFSDDESKMDMIERVFKGKMLPLVVIFFSAIVPQLFIQGHNPSAMGEGFFFFFVMVFMLYLGVFINFGYQYWKIKEKMQK